MNASVSIQIIPRVPEIPEAVRIIDQVIAYIKSTGLNYFVAPFDTTIEGDFDELMDIVKQVHLITIKEGAASVASYIKVAFHPKGDGLTIESKTAKFHS